MTSKGQDQADPSWSVKQLFCMKMRLFDNYLRHSSKCCQENVKMSGKRLVGLLQKPSDARKRSGDHSR